MVLHDGWREWSRMKLPHVVIALILAGNYAPCLMAYMRGYLPLHPSELSRRFPLRKGAEAIDFASVQFVDSIVRFQGRDRKGGNWKVEAGSIREPSIYSADLDRNGQRDILLAKHTGGNGLAPTMHLLVLLFDDVGRPFPLELDGYLEIDERGIADVVDLNLDGRAEIVRQSYDDGYWITSLYEARGGFWHRVKGPHANRQYPLYTRFTHRANRLPVTPAAGRHPVEDDRTGNRASR